MADTVTCRAARLGLCGALLWSLAIGPADAVVPKKPSAPLDQKEFFLRELYISTANARLAEVMDRLPNRAAWATFGAQRAAEGSAVHAFIDPRSGVATNIVRSVPLIPGRGVGNSLTVQSLGQRLGRNLTEVDAAAVAEATLGHVWSSRGLLGIDLAQLGEVRATRISADLWQISVPQRYRGIPVRHGRLAASVSHGNLVTIGAQTWGNVVLPDVTPTLKPETAVAAGFAYAEGREAEDVLLGEPSLEIVPFAPTEHQAGERFAGPLGSGYGHRLVWTFVFRRPPAVAQWEVIVDAHSGEVIAFQGQVHYAKRHVTGGVYPLTNTEICPDNQTCGAMQNAWPMPFADTGLPAPNEFTNGGGVCEYTGGTATTTLTGRYVRIDDGFQGNPILSKSSAFGSIGLGGTNGQHDDTTPTGEFGGNNPPARTAFYEVNKIAEIARGYLPNNAWLQGTESGPVSTAVNQGAACNAFYDPRWGGSIGFLRAGEETSGDLVWVCRNTGEIAAVLDHEWGHALDDHDANGTLSSTSEAYADIAAIYRTQTSCLGHGFFQSNPEGCGPTADGTGFNVNEAQEDGRYCTTNCSGVRDADWTKYDPSVPANPGEFVCRNCFTGPGPCGRQVHCAAAPVRQAAWDLVARELTAPPFNLDRQSAFIVGNKLFYQGSGNVGLWYTCTCGEPTNGCAADNGYMQWIIADDDNGNLADGTPHMTAIYNAFFAHGIACRDMAPINSGCAGAPTSAPTLTASPGHYKVSLSWNSVGGATRYWVFRTEGHAGCDYGKALIAEVTGLTYTDTDVAAGRSYYYNVVAAGSSSACYTRASNCASATPTAGSYNVSCTPSSLTIPGSGGSATSTCAVTSTGGYASAVSLGCSNLPGGASCRFSPASVTPPANGSASSTLTLTTAVVATPAGTYGFKVRGMPSAAPLSTHTATLSLTVGGSGTGDLTATFDAARQAPSCGATVGRSCDTGRSLVLGRAGLGPEPNQPNTINDACADGASGTFPDDGSNDRIRVATMDGTNFAPDKTVQITATVRARTNFQEDAADFFYAADATNPSWVFIGTSEPTASGDQTLSTTYVLPKHPLQAVRVQFRRLSDNEPCSPGGFNDRDDLIFAVQ